MEIRKSLRKVVMRNFESKFAWDQNSLSESDMVSGIPHFKNKVMAREKVSNMKTKDCRTIRINVRNGSINT